MNVSPCNPPACRAATRGRVWFAALIFWLGLAVPAGAEPFPAGDYSFSDELGGFVITGVSGIGTREDPIVIEQTLFDTEPVIMVIRRRGNAPDTRNLVGAGRWVAVHLRLVVRNESRAVWQGFQLELQEILHKPSVRHDGLSFDQGAVISAAVTSSRFAASQRLFEPYDRIRFENGHVNPLDSVDFRMHITDPTPVDTFYLLLDPEILYSFQPPRSDARSTG